jgi:hypothetical protein
MFVKMTRIEGGSGSVLSGTPERFNHISSSGLSPFPGSMVRYADDPLNDKNNIDYLCDVQNVMSWKRARAYENGDDQTAPGGTHHFLALPPARRPLTLPFSHAAVTRLVTHANTQAPSNPERTAVRERKKESTQGFRARASARAGGFPHSTSNIAETPSGPHDLPQIPPGCFSPLSSRARRIPYKRIPPLSWRRRARYGPWAGWPGPGSSGGRPACC